MARRTALRLERGAAPLYAQGSLRLLRAAQAVTVAVTVAVIVAVGLQWRRTATASAGSSTAAGIYSAASLATASPAAAASGLSVAATRLLLQAAAGHWSRRRARAVRLVGL